MSFTIGIFNGTSMIVDENDMLICADSIIGEIIGGAQILRNETTSGDIFTGLYSLYDMVAALHPTVFYCRKTLVDAYYGSSEFFDSLDDIRRIIDNLVHNFAYMMDIIFDVSSFFNSGDRGQYMEGPYDAGFGIGMLVFYLLADDTTSVMVDPAEGAEMPLKFDWGENIARWKEEDRIADELEKAEEERKKKEKEEKEKNKNKKVIDVDF